LPTTPESPLPSSEPGKPGRLRRPRGVLQPAIRGLLALLGALAGYQLADRIHALLTQDGAGSEGLGKLAALSGVREFPARVKCASLCWHTLNAALAQSDSAAPIVSTE